MLYVVTGKYSDMHIPCLDKASFVNRRGGWCTWVEV